MEIIEEQEKFQVRNMEGIIIGTFFFDRSEDNGHLYLFREDEELSLVEIEEPEF